MTIDDDNWWSLAEALGFISYEPRAWYRPGMSFRHLTSSFGPPATVPNTANWLYGERKAHAVILKSYENASVLGDYFETAVILRIDPPLLLGLAIGNDDVFPYLFGTSSPIGIPAIDGVIRVGAHDPDRLRALLWPSDERGRALLLAMLTRHPNLHVTDSTVVLVLRGLVTDGAAITSAIDHCVVVADELAARRAALPAEKAQRRAWQEYAEAASLAFDPSRMTISGYVRSTYVEIALDTHGGRLYTEVNVRWPQSFDFQMRVVMTRSIELLMRIVTQDLKTGDPAFDDAFIVQGDPKEDVVRLLVASPELRNTLRTVATHAHALTMHPGGIFWTSAPAQLRSELEAHVAMALRATEAIFGTLQAQQPFR